MNIDLFWKLMVAVPGRVAWVVGLIILQPLGFSVNWDTSMLWIMVFIGLGMEMTSYVKNNFRVPEDKKEETK